METRPVPSEAEAGATLETLGVAELRSSCETLLLAIVGEGGSREKAELHAPGATENPDTSVRGWLRYNQQLHRMHAVLVGHGDEGATARRERVQEALTAALSEEPSAVTCSDGVVRFVHPKSFHALAWLDSLDRQYLANAQAAAGVADLETADEYRTHALAPLLTSLAVRLWLWILTSKGAGLPFDESMDGDRLAAKAPKWTLTVTPEDLLRFWQAHVAIHQERLAIISRAFPSDGKSQSRLPLAGFIGALAHENGQDARLLMRTHSLGKLFATSVSAAETARDARRRAESTAGATD